MKEKGWQLRFLNLPIDLKLKLSEIRKQIIEDCIGVYMSVHECTRVYMSAQIGITAQFSIQ